MTTELEFGEKIVEFMSVWTRWILRHYSTSFHDSILDI